MKIYLGCDHAAFEEKERLKGFLTDLGHQVQDMGPHSGDRVNYPDFAEKVAREVANKNIDEERGILLCGSGIGVSMVANRFAGVRAALCGSVEDAKLSRGHNNANVLCVGARLRDYSLIEEMAKAWLETPFDGGRHLDRINIFTAWGEK
jgi:ribose 5-phosphate isomerase B